MADLKEFIESSAALTIQEILAPFRDGEGIARPSQYEVLFFPPTGYAGSGGSCLLYTSPSPRDPT